MIEWLLENKEWVFSGIGVALGAAIIGFLYRSRQDSSDSTQTQVSQGNNSPNIQSGRDTHIKK